MTWTKPGPGRLAGSPNAGSPNRDKPFRAALRMEIAALQAEDNKRGLRRLARAPTEKGADGDVQAIREVADRLDGKGAQAIAGDDLPPVSINVTGVRRAGDPEH